ncbi:MAG TPA: PDC sensor domain-containing protein, partial [Gaiellaceae bacterium]|nr:PDC sensor domain-containing protein [Gaiellaceae bacterium]
MALPLTATLAYVLVSDRSDDQQSAFDSSLGVAQLVAANLGRLLDDSRSQLAGIAERPLVRASDPERCDPIVGDFADLHPEFTNLAVVDLAGRVVCSALPQPGGEFVSVAETRWFRTARATGQFTVSEPLVGPISGEWVSVLAQPIRGSDGRLVGLIALGIDLVRYQSAFGNAVLPRDGLITVVD